MSADSRCGIDLGPAVVTYDSIDPADSESKRNSNDGSFDLDGSEAIVREAGDSVATAVVSAVADAKGVDPLDLDPLYEIVDGDALEAMFAQRDGSSDLEVRFSMAGCEVVVGGAGDVSVTPPMRRGTADAAPTHGD